MLTRELPVEHKGTNDLGRGIIVGSELIPSLDDNQQLTHMVLTAVIWENKPTPCPSYHNPEDLVCTLDFDDEFETGEDEDEDDDPEEIILDEDEIVEIVPDENAPTIIEDNETTNLLSEEVAQ